MFYLSNVAIVVNMSQPSVRIGGGLHALIDIFYTGFKEHQTALGPYSKGRSCVLLGLHLECCFLFSPFRESSPLSTSLAIQLKPFRF